MNPIQDYLFNPDPSIGGAIIPILAMPGAGKTVALSHIAMEGIKNNEYVLWRGTKQAEWDHLLANDIDITIWNHESITSFEAFITADKVTEQHEPVDLEDKGVEIRQWSEPEDILNNMQLGRVNVINIPGLSRDKNNLYFFRKLWTDIFEALAQRKTGRMIRFLFDELGDVIPSQQVLKKPFHELVVQGLPSNLAQMRKKRVLLYGAAHSSHDLHYYFWKIKSNTILYMSNAIVKHDVTPMIDQEDVTGLDRGRFVMGSAGNRPGSFSLPRMPNELDWVPESPYRLFNVDWTANIPDVLDEARGRSGLSKSKAAAMAYEALSDVDGVDVTQTEIADIYGIKQQALSKAL